MSDADVIDLFATDSADRVRAHTATAIQGQLDRDLVERLRHFAAERYAIKALRGDFTSVTSRGDANDRTRAVLAAVSG
jgi:hypothetical protein